MDGHRCQVRRARLLNVGDDQHTNHITDGRKARRSGDYVALRRHAFDTDRRSFSTCKSLHRSLLAFSSSLASITNTTLLSAFGIFCWKMPDEYTSTKRRHREKGDEEKKSKKRHKHHDDDKERKHKSKRKRTDEGKSHIRDDDMDEDVWVEKNIDMEGEQVRSTSPSLRYICS